MNMRIFLSLIFIIFMATPMNDYKYLYYKYDGEWKSINVEHYKPFKNYDTDGIYVELPMGTTGINPLSAILVPYDKYKDHNNLVAYDTDLNIALLYYKRWNIEALSLSAPDATEIIKKHGFNCDAIDVCRLLRLIYRD